ncbi:MAG: hypothetical protein BWY04_01061 [candidate division CPR1 bacterium ADurb.Bin160]|uniref:Uncharacterized protein n=1 Tax=candidate division CPR1 bacterium ADurb.Bin160 TaxID=1852826 RepID=A0A1V5ZLV3_9BACT|nr:MAG: hypothetical protein BWY04_01061 [candidate division CPR1 bacterium ADurb.Bin160]
MPTKIIKIEDHYGKECLRDSFTMKNRKDNGRPAGFVEIYETNNETEIKKLLGKHNLVVYQGREQIGQRLLGIKNPNIPQEVNEFVCWFGLGSGGVTESNPFDPISPTNQDLDLNEPVMINETDPLCGDFQVDGYYKHPFDSVETEQDHENDEKYLIWKIIVTVDVDDANDNIISEAGLYTASNSSGGYDGNFHLYARVTFPALVKTSLRSFIFVWYLFF